MEGIISSEAGFIYGHMRVRTSLFISAASVALVFTSFGMLKGQLELPWKDRNSKLKPGGIEVGILLTVVTMACGMAYALVYLLDHTEGA